MYMVQQRQQKFLMISRLSVINSLQSLPSQFRFLRWQCLQSRRLFLLRLRKRLKRSLSLTTEVVQLMKRDIRTLSRYGRRLMTNLRMPSFQVLISITTSSWWLTLVREVLTSRSSSLRVCVVWWPIHQVTQSNSQSSLTSVKVLTYSSTSSLLTVLVRDFLIQLLEQPIQDTLHVEWLTYHRNLLFVKLTVLQARKRFLAWQYVLSWMEKKLSSHCQIVSQDVSHARLSRTQKEMYLLRRIIWSHQAVQRRFSL